MENLLRFSDYNIFGYLVPGLVALGICDVLFGSHLVLGVEWTISHTGFVILLGYVAGHIVSEFATLVLDRWIVRGLVGTPANVLMQDDGQAGSKGPRWWRWLISEYVEPLPPNVRDLVMHRAKPVDRTRGSGIGETLFWRAWPVIKREPIPYGRMDSFLRLYGFCRSLSFVSLVSAVAFVCAWAWSVGRAQVQTQVEVRWHLLWWAAVALFIAAMMFKRYVKFLRHYGVEVFSTFAESKSDADEVVGA